MLAYQEYMMDYMNENRNDEMQYLGNDRYEELHFLTEDEDEKTPVYKVNYFLRDHLQMPKVHNELAKNRVREEIIEFTGTYIDTNNKALSTSGPVYKLTFGAKETKFLYDTFHTSAEELVDLYNELVKETYYGKISKFITGWITNAPHKLLLTAILIDAVQNNYQDIKECMEYLWAFSEYPILYHEYWATGVKEDVMNYTIEHLGPKFKITKMQNLQEFLKYDVDKAVQLFGDQLVKGVDNVYIDLMRSIRTRLNSSLRNIANAYYENNEKNRTQHTSVTTFDDGSLADQGGTTANMSQVIDKVTSKFRNSDVDSSMIKVAADSAKVDTSILAGYVHQIYSTKNNRIPEFIETIVLSYFAKYPSNSSIISNEYLNFVLALYRSIGTSGNELYQKIKAILAFWMNDIIGIESQYKSPTSRINYTRAVFNYMVLMINRYAD